LAALGIAGGALALASRRGYGGGWRAAPPLAPADRTLAWASPAVLAGNPRRRFYSGINHEQAVTIEDLRAMAHRRLPGFVTEYLEAGGEDEAALARNIAALADWRFLHRSLQPDLTACSGCMPTFALPKRRPRRACRLRKARCRMI
jgi:hypothetical protein